MKKIKITHDCLVKGQHTPAGTEVTVDIVTGQQLLDAGVGTEIKPGKVVNANADKVENRDPAVETRDPAPAADAAPAKPAAKRAKAKPEPAAAAEPAPVPADESAPATDPAPAADTPAE